MLEWERGDFRGRVRRGASGGGRVVQGLEWFVALRSLPLEVPSRSPFGTPGPVGSTSFTPDGKNLVTCSGARRFDLDLRLDSDEESSSDDEEQPVPDPVDSLQLWTLK